jgi:L-lactate utilization protein LutC
MTAIEQTPEVLAVRERTFVFQTARYAVFHTGPSATGDIEGVLIHGAQGVRSLTVIVDE